MFNFKTAFSVFSVAVVVSNFTYASTQSCSEMVSSLAKLKYQTLMPGLKQDMAERLQDQRAILTQLKNELTREEEAQLLGLLEIGTEKRMALARKKYPDLAVTERLNSLRDKFKLLKSGVVYFQGWRMESCPEGIKDDGVECSISENLALYNTKLSQIHIQFDEENKKVEIKACSGRPVRTSGFRLDEFRSMVFNCSTITFPGRVITGINSVNDSLVTDQNGDYDFYGLNVLKQIHGIDLKVTEREYVESEVALVCKDEELDCDEKN